MNRFWLFIIGLLVALTGRASVWFSVNLDKKTCAAMTAAYLTESVTEGMNEESVKKILDHYSSAEVATAGIFSSKWLDRQAMENAGLFSTEENFYYKRIYTMVSTKIMPKIIDVAALMIKYPENAIYWGPYLYKVCQQTKQLCMIFETVVSNGRLSFQDVVFLAVSDDLKPLFDLASLGDVDWEKVWDRLADFGSSITKEDLEEDLNDLMTAGGAIASAGGAVLDSVWANSSKVGTILHSKPKEIIDQYYKFKDMYETFSNPDNIKNLLMQQIISTDSTGVVNLFQVDNYNITSYVSDYIHELQGQYYTQRWYIYRRDSGSEHVCSYSPSTSTYDMAYGSEWYRVNTDNPGYVYTQEDYENSLSNSERYAGWSRERCNQLNVSGGEYRYDFYNSITWTRVLGSGGGNRGIAYAHYIDVYKTWNVEEEVYEELFDSQYDVEEAIQARFNAKLQELNCNEEGKHYYLGKDAKHYYSAADEKKMQGCATVSFQMECDEEAQLGEGGFSWKESADQYNALDEDSKRYAMESTLSGSADYSQVDAEIQKWNEYVLSLQSQIDVLDAENDDLLDQIASASIEEAAGLRVQYNANRSQIDDLSPQLSAAKDSLTAYQNMKQEITDDYADERDGTYRIPAVMHELESAYSISWSDEGSWQGWSFVRHGHMPNVQGELTFKADLSVESPEKWLINFWGIRLFRIRRAVLAVHWTLKADYNSSSIVETMELDNSLSDEEKASQVNQRLRELMKEHPGCSIEPSYAYSKQVEIPQDEDAVHLLWVNDRLKIARDVDYRLSKIYAQLTLVEKFMRSRESVLDCLKHTLGVRVLNAYGRTRVGNKSFRRWRRSAAAAAAGTSIADVLADDTGDDDI